MTRLRVLLVDDEQLVCRYLSTVLQTADDLEVVGIEHDGAAAVDAAVRLRPDVILMDLRMPGVNGVTATARIRKLAIPTKIIALTIFDTDGSVLGAMRAGADAFLLKATPPQDLFQIIRVVAGGQTVLSPAAANRLLAAGTDDETTVLARQLISALTERERDVAVLISQGHSNADIAGRLELTEATIKGYVSRVLAKLACDNRTQAGLLVQSAKLGSVKRR